ncbi:MAG: two-component system, NtrC family, nitrogen regulation sensor histidine kinase NtrY [Gemmatimonadales bacterium]|jgi:signal transduction histidine kinase|nr:two-component system, NtrC family, nitrogen regulation sensor histidine kinase NtrY [Gemmatimonadales bacterium]
MSFRTRLFLGILVAVLLPLGALAYGVRREMERRLTAEYEQRVGSMAGVIEADLAREGATIGSRLRALISDLSRDNRFRLAALQGDPGSRRYLLDYAGNAMGLSGLSMLQIQDSAGRILSSGHFRNEFDQVQPELPAFLATAQGSMALVRARTAETPLLALARVDSFRVGGRRFSVVGGVAAEPRLDRLGREQELLVDLIYPGGEPVPSSGARVLREIPLPYLDLLSGTDVALDTARVVVTQSLGTLEALQRSVDRWFLVAVGLTVAAALLLAGWLSSRISRPLRDLALKTSDIDLDRLDQRFESERTDEIGALSRLLGGMTERLRNSTARLREAERRAAVGDLARQVNHDIKNGLAPIRNVLRHFSQVARQDPALLPAVFEERKGTLDSSVEYLETLARNYARLSPTIERAPCDVNALVEEVLRNTAADGRVLHTNLSPRLPNALGDTLMLRRILENLVGNAVDSLGGRSAGTVTVTTEAAGGEGAPAGVRIIVADTGSGMTRKELDQAFDDFYSTKPHGTGLGLSIVRRLILDLNGTLRVETEPGTGTRFVVDLPADQGGPAT